MTLKLYKYVSMPVAKLILEGSKIGFTKPKYFNDPFDQPAAIPAPAGNAFEALFANVGAQGKSYIWGENTAILSLTRTATSPLMWAHYSDSHRGAVIEFDAAAAGLTDHGTNMIPAQFGSVIYVRGFNTSPYQSSFGVGITVGETHQFVLEHYEKWQRLFLTKPLDWAYEEEVRVVKCVKGVSGVNCATDSGVFSVFKPAAGGEVHAFHLPPGAITGVTVGVRATESHLAALKGMAPDLTYTRAKLQASAYAVVLQPA